MIGGTRLSYFHSGTTYYYRLYDRYRRPLASLVVLADDRANWRPDSYRRELWGCEATLRFPLIKLLDYRSRQTALEADANPFAVMTLAHLKAQETATDIDKRYAWKLRLVKSLYRRGYERQEILELFRFIDWLLALPEELEERLWNEVKAYEEGEKMPYVTSVERIGIRKGHQKGHQEGHQKGHQEGYQEGHKKGLQEGHQEGHQEGQQEGQQKEAEQLLRRLLTRRFGLLPEWVEAKLNQADTATLENWAERLLFAGDLDAVFREE